MNFPQTKYKSVQPTFRDNQDILTDEGLYDLTSTEKIIIIKDFLSPNELNDYISAAGSIVRTKTEISFGNIKPRLEYEYNVVNFPEHINMINKKILKSLTKNGIDTKSTIVSCIDALYGPDFTQGGSNGFHSETSLPWQIMVIYNLGQTRWLRIKLENINNIRLYHNSLIILSGQDFWHKNISIDKLPKDSDVYTYHNLIFRYATPINEDPFTESETEVDF